MKYDLNTLPAPVQEAVSLFREAQQPAWLVGGATRDLLLGREVKDFDFVLGDDGLHWARRLANALGGAFVALDEERRVGRVVVRHNGKPLWLDVASFRGLEDRGEGSSLEEDLRLRDLTLNAIAIELDNGQVVDPTGGMADLEAGRLRMTGERSFIMDPLRILRAVRLHATHELEIEPATLKAMRAAAGRLEKVAAERVREEWMRLLAPPGAMARIEMLDSLTVLDVLQPELVACKGVTQSAPHSHDVFGHSLLVLEAIEELWPWVEGSDFWRGDLQLFSEPITEHLQTEIAHETPRWLLLKHVALLHDIGKPPTRTVGNDGRIHFYQHDRVGAEMIRKVMRRMKFPARCVDYAHTVVFQHLRPLNLSNNVPPGDRAVYRFFRDTGESGPDVALHSVADQRGKAFATDRPAVLAVVYRLLEAWFREPERFVRPTPLIDGSQVIALTGLQGPAIGEILEKLREQQAQGHVHTVAEAEQLVRQLAQNPRKGKKRK